MTESNQPYDHFIDKNDLRRTPRDHSKTPKLIRMMQNFASGKWVWIVTTSIVAGAILNSVKDNKEAFSADKIGTRVDKVVPLQKDTPLAKPKPERPVVY